ncbi:hypothetical protein B5180_12195 [Streptomyces sp. BF-3]|nr:hypothetical protein B5180_12195 [Streptomyces sp. BF-3]
MGKISGSSASCGRLLVLGALDTAGPGFFDTQDQHDALSRVAARMRWYCPDPAQPSTASLTARPRTADSGAASSHRRRGLRAATLAKPP